MPVQYLKGVGPVTAKKFSRLGIETVNDLLHYYPRDYSDRRNLKKIAELSDGEKAGVLAQVETARSVRLRMNLQLLKVEISDGTGILYLQFFRRVSPYARYDVFGSMLKDFSPGRRIIVYGRVEKNFGLARMAPEEYEILDSDSGQIHTCRIVPVYSLTAGLRQTFLRELIYNLIEPNILSRIVDFLPPAARAIAQEQKIYLDLPSALKQIHFPDDEHQLHLARQSLVFREFLVLQSALLMMRQRSQQIVKPQRYEVKKTLLGPFKENLGFEFTPGQKKAIREIFSDLLSPHPMNRLLIGDVGCGKTVVALAAALLAVENGYQACFLAPTEILAEQHYRTITGYLKNSGVLTILLTAKLSARDRKKIQKEISEGRANIIVGTHALLEEPVKFKNLSLLVIDEQHRFGVLQRAALRAKSWQPDVLLLSATPIPRTLMLCAYGDLSFTIIRDMPPGRRPVKTYHFSEAMAYQFIKEEVARGNQAFIVYPLVDESDKLELKSATWEAKKLAETVFADERVGLLHGQMPARKKEEIMNDFRQKKISILIATTVVEVGVDIPDATVMVIEHADRYGLATLHQLRGRVGRSNKPSYCLLIGRPGNEIARKRLEVILTENDGFKIAEEDLKLRGPGEIMGTAQHGLLQLRLGNILTDTEIVRLSHSVAELLVKNDPGLSHPENLALRAKISQEYRQKIFLSAIG